MQYKRILYKLSGESFNDANSVFYKENIVKICHDLIKVYKQKTELCISVGGGNIFRGRDFNNLGIQKVEADKIGMLATVMNGITLQNILQEMFDVKVSVFSSIQIDSVCEVFQRNKALERIENGEILIFVGGIGSPLFSTDTSSAIRAVEMNCDVLIKATKVDGVYSDDPEKNKNAEFFNEISYKKAIEMNLNFMDQSAMSILKENEVKSIIFSVKNSDSPLYNLLTNETKKTMVTF